VPFGKKNKGKPISTLDKADLRFWAAIAQTCPPDVRQAAIEEWERRYPDEPIRGGIGAHPSTNGTGSVQPAVGSQSPPPMPPASRLLSAADLAAMLKVSVRSVWRMRDDGRLPKPLELGKQMLRWDRDEIERAIGTRQVGQHRTGAEQSAAGERGPLPADDNR
jgi:predicted DNA-binding transcriptional regulator AlpA